MSKINAELYEACKAVLAFFDNLEGSLELDDPLRTMRQKYHKPVRDKLTAVLAKADGLSGKVE